MASHDETLSPPSKRKAPALDFGWELSASFCDYFFPILFVICADPSLVSKTVSSIKGTWGEGKVQKKV